MNSLIKILHMKRFKIFDFFYFAIYIQYSKLCNTLIINNFSRVVLEMFLFNATAAIKSSDKELIYLFNVWKMKKRERILDIYTNRTVL